MLLSYFITWFSCTLISHEFMNSWKHHLIFMNLDKSWIPEFLNSWKHHLIFMYLDKSWIHESITWFSCTLLIEIFWSFFSNSTFDRTVCLILLNRVYRVCTSKMCHLFRTQILKISLTWIIQIPTSHLEEEIPFVLVSTSYHFFGIFHKLCLHFFSFFDHVRP